MSNDLDSSYNISSLPIHLLNEEWALQINQSEIQKQEKKEFDKNLETYRILIGYQPSLTKKGKGINDSNPSYRSDQEIELLDILQTYRDNGEMI